MPSFIAALLSSTIAGPDAPRFLSQPSRRNFDAMFNASPDRDTDGNVAALVGDAFEPEQCYFSVRVVEMWMAEAGNYFAKFLPMCSCFLRYGYGTTIREVPYIISHDMLRREMKLTGDAANDSGSRQIRFSNIYIVKDAPVKASGLTLYAGLSRVADSSFARGMLDLIGDAVAAAGGPAAGVVAQTGLNMTKRLAAVLGADGISTRFGIYDGNALIRSGYRVLAGAGLDAVRIEMVDERLRRVDTAGNTTPVDDVDYLILAFEYRKTLLNQSFGSLAHLPFHAKWSDLTKLLVSADASGADACFNQLAAEIVASPDLIETDRLGVLASYAAQMDKWRQFKRAAPVVKASGQTLRGLVIDSADTLSKGHREASKLLRRTAQHLNDYRDDAYAGEGILSDEALTDKLICVGTDLTSQKPSISEVKEAINSLLVATLVP